MTSDGSDTRSGAAEVVADPAPASRRYKQLDALRGLAALTVVFNHCMMIVQGSAGGVAAGGTLLAIVKYTPLHLVWAGDEAVLFFFVLSGFVLSLPFHGARNDAYPGFLVKRICRIWLPYVAIMALALAARLLFEDYGPKTGMTAWYNSVWADPLTALNMVNQFSLIGFFQGKVLDPVVWSLTIEMRISIVFPLLVLVGRRWRWHYALGLSVAIGVLGYAVQYSGLQYSIGRTLSYVPIFMVGILAARYRSELASWCRDWSERYGVWSLLLAGAVAYTYAWWALPGVGILHVRPADDWVTTLGILLIIGAALGSRGVTRVLTHRIPIWLGNISYSLYLIHSVVLVSLVHLVYGQVPLWTIWLATLVISLVLSTASYHWIELPAIALGRRLVPHRTPRAPEVQPGLGAKQVEVSGRQPMVPERTEG